MNKNTISNKYAIHASVNKFHLIIIQKIEDNGIGQTSERGELKNSIENGRCEYTFLSMYQ